MIVTQVQVLRGPNRYATWPMIELVVDAEAEGDESYWAVQAFSERIMALQREAGPLPDSSKVMSRPLAGTYRLAIAYDNEARARAAVELATREANGESLGANEIAELKAIPQPTEPTDEVRARQSGKFIVAVTGTNGKTTTSRLIAHLYATGGEVVGFTSTEGTYINGKLFEDGDNAGPKSARDVLLNPEVEIAVLETARGGILREGLAFDQADVAVVTNVAADHLGLRGINTVEELAEVKGVLVDALAPDGAAVLNAEDGLVAAMARRTKAETIYFALDKAAVTDHLKRGGRAVYRAGNAIMLGWGQHEEQLTNLSAVPVTLGGALGFQVQNALAAVAAAWAGDMPLDKIVNGLATFKGDMAMSHGRFNFFDLRGATVILDYGHNAAALRALGQAAANLPATRRIVMVATAGDRRDEDIRLLGEEAARWFDQVIAKDVNNRRGRRRAEVSGLIREGALRIHPEREVLMYTDLDQAYKETLAALQAGELLLICEDDLAFVMPQMDAAGAVARA